MVRYDDANAAAVEQDYVDGTHVGTITVTIDGGGSGATGTADVYLLTCEPQRPIGGINALRGPTAPGVSDVVRPRATASVAGFRRPPYHSRLGEGADPTSPGCCPAARSRPLLTARP
jgi:hypothetical protein